MHQLIITMLSIAMGAAFLYSTLSYTGSNIELKERSQYKMAYTQLIKLNESYKEYNNQPLDASTWENDLSKYGTLPTLPPKSSMSYNFDTTNEQYYFCITRDQPNKSSHKSISGLRAGFPRVKNINTELFEETDKSGYSDAHFNVNTSCGATSDYVEEPLEDETYLTALSATMWLGGLNNYYNEESVLIGDDFKKLKIAFDSYVVANGSAPTVAAIDSIFTLLRPHGELPLQHSGFSWEYGLNGGSNYFCLKTNDTSSYNDQEREIHAESIYQLDTVFDNSYFKINRSSCTSSSQARTTDYSSAITVFGTYWLN